MLKIGQFFWISRLCGRHCGLSKTHINPADVVFSRIGICFILSVFLISCGTSTSELLTQANTALESEDTQTAAQLFQKIIDRHPESPDAIAGMLSIATIEQATESQIHWSREVLKYQPWHREANLITGKQLIDEGNLKDAVIRLTLAFQNSTFQNEKKEALDLLQQAVNQAQQTFTTSYPLQEQNHDSTQ